MTFREDALADKHIVISGGAGAIGCGVVSVLTRHGASVTVNDVLDAGEALPKLERAGAAMQRVFYCRADLTQEEDVNHLVAEARAQFGPLHVALCHAGMVAPGLLLDYSLEDWQRTQNVNVTAAFLLGRAAARSMLADDVAGHLIFTTSWVAQTPWPEIGAYNASKAAMNQLMRSFARELAQQGIRANAVAPGIVNAGMARKQWDSDAEYQARARRAIPLGMLQPLEAVTDAFLFLCSGAASYMTGSVLTVDGGCSLYPLD
ncbi:MAG: SDR family NAD(P)-dependent oxidoreductase [Anaerolineaceae bacterium]|nr:SDR family NAD(P)-dependent oxidoreductase [Anaerolineaceae bacterium]